MITVDYVQTMARYNQWQNNILIGELDLFEDAALREDRGAFFGSIFGTINHLLWADRIWMARIDGWEMPPGGITESVDLYPTYDAWKADRMRADARIQLWADKMRPADLRGDMTWHSALLNKQVTEPRAFCIMHFFNHQTHHRGQVHAMLTAAGVKTADTDLFVMPEVV